MGKEFDQDADEIILDASKHRVRSQEEIEEMIKEEELKSKNAPIRKEKTFKFSEKKLNELRETYSCVVVRDFGDNYHKSTEELESTSKYADWYKKIGSHKNRYRRIVDYVYAFRDCYNFVEKLAEENSSVMKPSEFMKEALAGRIEISGFQFPKYTGRDKKDINWDNVKNYIIDQTLDPLELSQFADIESNPIDELENPEKYLSKYFSDEQLKFIFEDSKNIKRSTMSFDEELDEWDIGVVRKISKKKMKKTFGAMPDLVRPLKDFRRRRDAEGELRDFAYELEQDAFEYISRLDEKRGFYLNDRIPEFNGNIMSEDDVNKYLYDLDEFERRNTRINYHGQFITLEDYHEEQVKEALEESGWNIMALYNNKEIVKKLEKENKRDKKKEKRLKKELSRLKKRRDERSGTDELKINKKKKKPKKRNQKKNKKLENVIVSASKTDAKDFKEYESMMLDMSYGYED